MSGVIAGLVITGAGVGMSFAQASKQKNLQEDAIKAADLAMEAAKHRLNANVAEQQSIKKEAYDAERLAMTSTGAQLTNAGTESERGSAATAGRVYAGQLKGQEAIREAMSDEMTNIEGAIIEEEMRLLDLKTALDLEEVAGNQLRASEARAAADLATQQGIEGATQLAGDAVAELKLYKGKGSEGGVGGKESTELEDLKKKLLLLDPSNPFEIT
jgi:hypothetical protein